MIGWTTAFGVGAALVTAGFLALRPSEEERVVRRYAEALCLKPHQVQTGRAWSNDVTSADGSVVTVSADGFVGGLVLVRYADGTVRHVTRLVDYVHPHDVRLAPDAKTLWFVNRGLAGGVVEVAHVYEYDIPSRILVGEVSVEPELLPAPCPVTTDKTSDRPPTIR